MQKKIIIGILLLCAWQIGFAQVNIKLLPNDSMKFFRTDSSSVWGNFYNSGNSGTGGSLILEEGVNLIMYGDTFKNLNATQIGGGGEIIMTRPRPNPYPASVLQVFDGGGVISSIPDLTVNSPNNVELIFGDLKVRDSLKFVLGKIILNKHDLIVGNNNPGTITGYDENKYVMTNGVLTDTKGFLIRENIGNTNTVFPIGFDATHYEPGAILQLGTSDLMKMRVAEHVKSLGTFGTDQNSRSTQTTWFIEEGVLGGSNVTLQLQHQNYHEGAVFAANRHRHFISHYVGYSPNLEGDTVSYSNWDNFGILGTQLGSASGFLTTGLPIPGNTVTTRAGVTSFSPFAKTAWTPPYLSAPLPIELLSFSAKWKTSSEALVSWVINESSNNSKYTVLRSTNNASFEEIGELTPRNSGNVEQYQFSDFTAKDNNSNYYKLKIVDNLGEVHHSPARLLKKVSTELAGISIAPNPASGKFKVEFAEKEFTHKITVSNNLGQIVYTLSTEAGTESKEIELPKNISEGTYFIWIENEKGKYSSKLLLY